MARTSIAVNSSPVDIVGNVNSSQTTNEEMYGRIKSQLTNIQDEVADISRNTETILIISIIAIIIALASVLLICYLLNVINKQKQQIQENFDEFSNEIYNIKFNSIENTTESNNAISEEEKEILDLLRNNPEKAELIIKLLK